MFGDERLEAAAALINESERLWVVYADLDLAYPFLKRFPAATAVALGDLCPDECVVRAQPASPCVLMFVDGSPPRWLEAGAPQLLWQSSRVTAGAPGALLRLP